MDKICRGSHVGEAHLLGSWADYVPDTASNARGTHITHTSMKLENTVPTGERGDRSANKGRKTSDTFRSQSWFRHDGAGASQEVSHLSRKFWQGVNGLSPAPASPRGALLSARSKSHRNLATAAEGDKITGGGDTGRLVDAKGRRVPVRSRSEGVLSNTPGAGTTTPRAGEGRRHRGPGSPDCASPRENSPQEKRAGSPTFAVSEEWMRYSSPRGTPARGERGSDDRDYSFEPPKRALRQQSGRITENSENHILQKRPNDERAPPVIANAVNHARTNGKKVGITKDEAQLKRRLAYDTSQQDPDRSQRRHDFEGHPQREKHLENTRYFTPHMSPRNDEEPNLTGGGSQCSRSSPQLATVRAVQHRTSPEMALSLAPDFHNIAAADDGVGGQSSMPSPPKYLAGNRLIAGNIGRKSNQDISVAQQRQHQQHHQQQQPHQLQGLQSAPVSMVPLMSHRGPAPPLPVYTPSPAVMAVPPRRDHRNSDVIREHLQPMHMQPPAAYTALARHLVSFGNHSVLKKDTPKDTAYLQSGLRVVRYCTRTPGAFSPQMARVPASQALAAHQAMAVA